MLSDNQPVRRWIVKIDPSGWPARSNAMRFNLSAWARRISADRHVYLMLLLASSVRCPTQQLGRAGPAVHLQGHGHPGPVAWRHRQGFTPGHRTHREEADEDRRVRAHRLSLLASPSWLETRCARKDIPSVIRSARSATFVTHTRRTGPFFNDEFGTTFGNIYALTGGSFDRDPQGLRRPHSAATAAG